MIDSVLRMDALSRAELRHEPFRHAVIDRQFDPAHARALSETYPADHYRIVSGGAEKLYRYDARPFVAFGRDEVMFEDNLAPEWKTLGRELASPAYREALEKLTGLDLTDALFEANLFHYGPRRLLEPHRDLADKIVTHVLYFNDAWNPADGGCLRILRSPDLDDCVTEVLPIAGTSVVLVRSEHSWHGVPAVRPGVTRSRRSMTATFYRPGSVSTLFPEGEDYHPVTVGRSGSGLADRIGDAAARLMKRITRRP